jgi:hypothetical protein
LIQTGPEPLPPSPGPPSTDPIDIEALLTERASAQGAGDAWRTSLDAFLVLLDLPAGPATITSLASELNLPPPDANDRGGGPSLQVAHARVGCKRGASTGPIHDLRSARTRPPLIALGLLRRLLLCAVAPEERRRDQQGQKRHAAAERWGTRI